MDFGEALQGGFFTFSVGPDRQQFQIHKSLVSRNSKPLDRLMNNKSMKESLENSAVLEDIEPETFIHFAEFCYKGNYWCTLKPVYFTISAASSANFAKRLLRANILSHNCPSCGSGGLKVSENPHFPKCSASCISQCTRCVVCGSLIRDQDPNVCRVCICCAGDYGLYIPKVNSKLWQVFKNREYGGMGMRHRELQQSLRNYVPKDEASNDILSHAKLFVFADRYDIQPLKDLSLHKLHRDLCQFKLADYNTRELVALLEFVYEHTMGVSEAESEIGIPVCDLGNLVILYAVCNAELLQHTTEFRRLLRTGDELVVDYTNLLIRRE